ncbi:MAG: hypothetical protein ACQESE_03720 [Nanobdellota archaeon]
MKEKLFDTIYSSLFKRTEHNAGSNAPDNYNENTGKTTFSGSLNDIIDTLLGVNTGTTPLEERYRYKPFQLFDMKMDVTRSSSQISPELKRTLNETIDKLTYDVKRGHLGRVARSESRELKEGSVNSVIGYLKDIRNYGIEHRITPTVNTSLAINDLKSTVEHPTAELYAYEKRFEYINNKLDDIENDIITKESEGAEALGMRELDTIAYVHRLIEKNSYLKRKEEYSEKRDVTLNRLSNILKRREYLLGFGSSTHLKQYL